MNARTDPTQLQKARLDSPQLEKGVHPLPADAELPIRSTFLPEDKLRKLGESLAKGEVETVNGLESYDFQQRNRDNARKILEVYQLTNDARRAARRSRRRRNGCST